MNKIGWFVCVCIFIFVTAFVMSVDTSTQTRQVQFSNQAFEINNRGNQVVNNSSSKINFNNTNIQNKQLAANNSKINLQSTEVNTKNESGFANKDVSYNNHSDYSSQKTNYNNQSSNYSNQSSNFQNSEPFNFKNLDDRELEIALNKARTGGGNYQRTGINDKPLNYMSRDRYAYQNIDWSKWKSNFVNKILDDSVYIKSLDRYQTGNWLWYSFIVDDRGRISNIQVKSPTIEQADKDKVAKLIKSYEYTAITIFPANSKRKTASISAVMMLSDEAQKSKPSDFNDIEHIKFKL